MTDAVRPLSPREVAGLLAATAATVRAEMGALSEELASWRPAAGEWCAKEVLGHLIEAERRGFAGRVRQLLAEDGATFIDWDPPAVAAARGDCDRPLAGLLAEFEALRADSVALVAGLTEADLARAGRHPEVGRLRIGDLLHEWVHHDRNHVRQLLAVAQAAAWPHMGNARRFSRPELPEE